MVIDMVRGESFLVRQNGPGWPENESGKIDRGSYGEKCCLEGEHFGILMEALSIIHGCLRLQHRNLK